MIIPAASGAAPPVTAAANGSLFPGKRMFSPARDCLSSNRRFLPLMELTGVQTGSGAQHMAPRQYPYFTRGRMLLCINLETILGFGGHAPTHVLVPQRHAVLKGLLHSWVVLGVGPMLPFASVESSPRQKACTKHRNAKPARAALGVVNRR